MQTQRLHKILEDAGVKLASVATDILGTSGRAMLDALVHGTTDPAVLAELARGRLRAKLPAALRAGLGGALSGPPWISGQRAPGASGLPRGDRAREPAD